MSRSPRESCRRRDALSPIIFTETRLKCGLSPDQCGFGTSTSCWPFCQLFNINGPEPAVFCARKPRASSAALAFSTVGLMMEAPSFARV